MRGAKVVSFDSVHSLLREGRTAQALKAVYDSTRGRIRREFSDDLNHAWYIVGDVRFKQGKTTEACAAFKKALSRRQDDWQAAMALANCYHRLGSPAIAERYLRKALAFNPKSPALHFNLGNALFDQGRYAEAIRSYRNAKKGKGNIATRAARNERRAQMRVRSHSA